MYRSKLEREMERSAEGGKSTNSEPIASYKDPLARVLREAIEIQELENKDIGGTSVERNVRKAQ